MSKIEAYRCDHCNRIVPDDEAVGILPIRDMFQHSLDYPTTVYPAQAEVHHCLDCSREKVILKAEELSPRHKDELAYQIRFHELYAIFKGQCVTNWMSKSKKNKTKYL